MLLRPGISISSSEIIILFFIYFWNQWRRCLTQISLSFRSTWFGREVTWDVAILSAEGWRIPTLTTHLVKSLSLTQTQVRLRGVLHTVFIQKLVCPSQSIKPWETIQTKLNLANLEVWRFRSKVIPCFHGRISHCFAHSLSPLPKALSSKASTWQVHKKIRFFVVLFYFHYFKRRFHIMCYTYFYTNEYV